MLNKKLLINLCLVILLFFSFADAGSRKPESKWDCGRVDDNSSEIEQRLYLYCRYAACLNYEYWLDRGDEFWRFYTANRFTDLYSPLVWLAHFLRMGGYMEAANALQAGLAAIGQFRSLEINALLLGIFQSYQNKTRKYDYRPWEEFRAVRNLVKDKEHENAVERLSNLLDGVKVWKSHISIVDARQQTKEFVSKLLDSAIDFLEEEKELEAEYLTNEQKKEGKGFWGTIHDALGGASEGIHEMADGMYGEKESRDSKSTDYTYPSGRFDVEIGTTIKTIYAGYIFEKANFPDFYLYFSSSRDTHVEIEIQALGDILTPVSEAHFGKTTGYIILKEPSLGGGRNNFDNRSKSLWSGRMQANEEKRLRMGPFDFEQLRGIDAMFKSLGTNYEDFLSQVNANVKYVFYISAQDDQGNTANDETCVYLVF